MKNTNETIHRFHELDVIKAASIVSVVCIHAIGQGFAATDPISRFLGDFTRFAVPGLLLATGFLFKKSDISDLTLAWKLLLRIVPPYVFCSLVILLLNLPGNTTSLKEITFSRFCFNLLFGHMIGIYYFVFVILYLYGLSFILRKLPEKIIKMLWVFSLAALILFYNRLDLFTVSDPRYFFFVLLRHPFIHLLPFLTGWLLSTNNYQVRAVLDDKAKSLFILSVVADTGLLLAISRNYGLTVHQLLVQAHVYCILLMLMILGIKGYCQYRGTVFLSQSSYSIFLIHYPLVSWFQSLYPQTANQFAVSLWLGSWMFGLFGSIVIITLFRYVFGKYSRHLIGY